MNIFLSYDITSPKDKKLFAELTTHLSILQSHYPTYEWYDSELSADSPITQFIEDRLNRADLIVLLVSADFFAAERSHEIDWKGRHPDWQSTMWRSV